MDTGLELGGFAFSLTLWAVLFWGSIRILEPGNGNNSFAKALGIGVLYGVCLWLVGHMALIGLFFAVAWLVFILRLLTDWYEMGILKSLGVTAVINIGPYYLIPKMFVAAGSSVYGLLFGFPAAVLIVWLVTSRKGSGMKIPTLPFARATKKRPEVPVASVGPVSPVVVAPIVRPVAPAAQPEPAGDKPRLLI